MLIDLIDQSSERSLQHHFLQLLCLELFEIDEFILEYLAFMSPHQINKHS